MDIGVWERSEADGMSQMTGGSGLRRIVIINDAFELWSLLIVMSCGENYKILNGPTCEAHRKSSKGF